VITSTANPHVKQIRALSADRRARHRERCFVLEGVRLLDEARRAGAHMRQALYAPDQLDQSAAGRQIRDWLATQPGCHTAAPRVVAAAADTVTPQGVVAVVTWPTPPPGSGLWLVLDAVQDPGNVGTLLRSAEAAGAAWLLSSQGTADLYSPKVVRAAMGAHFYLPLQPDCTWDELAAHLRDVPRIYAAVGSADLTYDAADWRGPVALIIGSEAQGISAAGLAQATHQIRIPMVGRAESLNAGVAGSIMLFEALRQRRHTTDTSGTYPSGT
jgi:TrmH family RNA methyltransferase